MHLELCLQLWVGFIDRLYINRTCNLVYDYIFWTPPHFWALAIISKSDYKLANIPMLPISSGNRETYFQILLHTIILVIITLAPYLIGMSSFVYLLVSVIFGIMLIIYMLRMCYLKKDEHALSAFKFSILYLFVIFSALIIDQYLQ